MSRVPIRPDRDAIPEAELGDYDYMSTRVGPSKTGWRGHPAATSRAYLEAWMTTPPIAAAVSRIGGLLATARDQEGGCTPADHEFVDQALSFDLDSFGLLPWHTPRALADGVRAEAIQALRQGREQDLTDDELQLLRFIRQVISGTVTDDSWKEMTARFGRVRGVVEFVASILVVQLHLRMFQALGVPAISGDEFDEMLGDLLNGTWQPLQSGHQGRKA